MQVVAVKTRCRVEREKLLFAVVPRTVSDHLRHLIDFEVQWTRPVGDDMEFMRRIVDMNSIDACLVKQVHCRRTKQFEIRRVDDALERGIAPPEQDDQFELVPCHPSDSWRQIPQFEKPE